VGVVIPLIVVIAVVAVAWAMNSSKKRKEQWKQAAPALGLSFAPGPESDRPIHSAHYVPQMYGQYDGQDVYVGIRYYTTGSGKNRTTHYYTFVDVLFEPGLKRGLAVARADGVSKFFGDLFGQRDIQIGNEVFDRDFRVKGNDPEQVKALLGRSRVLELMQLRIGSFTPNVDDRRVRFEASGIHVDAETLRPLLEPAVTLHRELIASWEELPATAEEARVAPTWKSVADKSYLQYASRGMMMHGRREPVDVRAEVVLDDSSWSTQVEVRFDPPLGVGLGISRQGVLATLGKLFGARDIKVGDRLFDDRFVIKGKDPRRVKEILVDDARRRLLMLDKRSDKLTVTDKRVMVTVKSIVEDPKTLWWLVDTTIGAASEMLGHRRPPSAGPFR
jgi:hypothetical protein